MLHLTFDWLTYGGTLVTSLEKSQGATLFEGRESSLAPQSPITIQIFHMIPVSQQPIMKGPI